MKENTTMAESEKEALFKKVQYQDTGLIDHASKIGVRLKSSSALSARKRSYSPRETSALSAGGATSNRKCSARTLMRAKSSMPRVSLSPSVPVEYIQNVVIPIGLPYDENSPRPATAFSGKSSLPKMTKRQAQSARTTLSTVSNKMLSSSTDPQGKERSPLEAEGASSNWGKSDQVIRFEHERESVEKSRELRKVTQVRSHRVDRMYYMCGTSLKIGSKYDLDEEEIQRLRDLVLAKKNAKINAAMSASYSRASYMGMNDRSKSAAGQQTQEAPLSTTQNDDVSKNDPAKIEIEKVDSDSQNAGKEEMKKSDQNLALEIQAQDKHETQTEAETVRTDVTIACSEPPTERMMESSAKMKEQLVFDDITNTQPADQSENVPNDTDQSETSLQNEQTNKCEITTENDNSDQQKSDEKVESSELTNENPELELENRETVSGDLNEQTSQNCDQVDGAATTSSDLTEFENSTQDAAQENLTDSEQFYVTEVQDNSKLDLDKEENCVADEIDNDDAASVGTEDALEGFVF